MEELLALLREFQRADTALAEPADSPAGGKLDAQG